jgi:hypothetical protein
MGLELVRIVSQCAGAVAVLSLVGCFVAAAAAVELSRAMLETADDAFQLARRIALLGAGCVILAAVTSTLYWWRAGVASAEAAIAIGVLLGLAALTFTVLARRLCRGI